MNTKTKIKNNHIFVKNKNIIENIQNIFNNATNTHIIVPNLCNNSGTFTGPVNSVIKSFLPEAETNYSLLTKKFLSGNLGYTQIIEAKKNTKLNNKIYVANMIAQNTNAPSSQNRTLNYYSLIKCMNTINKFIQTNVSNNDEIYYEIHSPKFGIGYPGGKWEFIQSLIEDVWSDKTVLIYNNLNR